MTIPCYGTLEIVIVIIINIIIINDCYFVACWRYTTGCSVIAHLL